MHEAVAAVRIHIAQEKMVSPSRDDKPEYMLFWKKAGGIRQDKIAHDSATDSGRC